MTPAIIGAGAWGTALGLVASDAGAQDVLLWSHDPAQAHEIATLRENRRRLPGVKLPANLTATANAAQLSACDTLFFCVPAQSLRGVLTQLGPHLKPGAAALICAKGIEQATGKLMPQVLAEAGLGLRPFLLSGPSFASDVAARKPAAVTLAGPTLQHAQSLAERLSTPAFRIYASADLTGVAIGGAAKNVLAIACGIAEGLDLGDSARAALTTRAFAELLRLGRALGAAPETLGGLSGLGDLLLTCSSPQSRNFSLGLALGREEQPTGKLAEGAFTAGILVRLAQDHGLDLPICEAVARVLDGSSRPVDEVPRLLTRPIKAEF